MKEILRINLTNEPVLKTDKNGKEFVAFGGAKDLFKKEGNQFIKTGREFYSVTAYDNLKDIALSFRKGDKVELMGFTSTGERNGKQVNFFSMKNGQLLMKKEEKAA